MIGILLGFFLFWQSTFSQPVDSFSTSSLSIIAFNKNNQPLWNGTGFLLKIDSIVYLISNNHVVGDEFYMQEYLRRHKKYPPNDSFPEYVTIRIIGSDLNSTKHEKIKLYNDKNRPTFIKFYQNKQIQTSLLDVVAIPLNYESTWFGGSIVYTENHINNNLLLYPSQDLFVVGFPYDYASITIFPIWKRASISSEPNLFPIFSVDATTRAGMSGSPVVFRDNNYQSIDGVNVFSGLVTYLVGVYSAQDYTSELGTVYKLNTIIAELKANGN